VLAAHIIALEEFVQLLPVFKAKQLDDLMLGNQVGQVRLNGGKFQQTPVERRLATVLKSPKLRSLESLSVISIPTSYLGYVISGLRGLQCNVSFERGRP
jgi:hypothetical protein